MQARNPAFGALVQRGDVGRREVQAHHLPEKCSSFGGGKAQIGGAQLGQVAAGAEASQGQLRIGAGDDHQVQLRWQVREQKGERIINRSGINDMVVVEHEHDQRPGG